MQATYNYILKVYQNITIQQAYIRLFRLIMIFYMGK